jgi:hypothetical protein
LRKRSAFARIKNPSDTGHAKHVWKTKNPVFGQASHDKPLLDEVSTPRRQVLPAFWQGISRKGQQTVEESATAKLEKNVICCYDDKRLYVYQ